MRRAAIAGLVISVACRSVANAQFAMDLAYSTYLGGSSWEHARDVYTDSSGFTYVVGGTASNNFTGAGSFPGVNTFNGGKASTTGDGAFGSADAFITKMNQSGQVLWTKYMGGGNYDRAYGVEVDNAGSVYIAGRAGIGFPTTPGLQATFQGTSGPSNYGNQNAIVAKLDANGQTLWSTYLGTGELCRDVALDNKGSIYVPLVMSSASSRMLDAGYFGGKIKNAAPTPNTDDVGIAKINASTGQLEWARWLGGTGSEVTNPSIRVNPAGEAYLLFDTTSDKTSLPAVGAVSQSNRSGTQDSYLAKFAADGSGLIFGTYLGGNGAEGHETHSLALDQNGNAVVAINTTSTDYPVTAGALHGGVINAATNLGITRFNETGARVASAVVGGTGGENPDGVYVDALGRIFITGETSSTDLPVTANALQSANAGSNDGFVMVLNNDLSRIDYSTYFGGSLYDNGRASYLGTDGTLYVVGGTLSTNFPTRNAADSMFHGGSNSHAPGSGDAWAEKFVLVPDASTLPGDANFDGTVNFDDLIALAQHYHQSVNQTWSTGDFTRDGTVNFDDLIVLAQHYNAGTPINFAALNDSSSTLASDWALAQSLAPEPSIAAVTLLLGVATLGKRTRRDRI